MTQPAVPSAPDGRSPTGPTRRRLLPRARRLRLRSLRIPNVMDGGRMVRRHMRRPIGATNRSLLMLALALLACGCADFDRRDEGTIGRLGGVWVPTGEAWT